MAKKIIWTEEALDNIERIAEFIEQDSQYYSAAFINKIFTKAETLKTLYKRGRIVPEVLDENMREIFVNEYRLMYRIEKDEIIILTAIHGRRDFKKLAKKNKNV